jgi:hypothetical protein
LQAARQPKGKGQMKGQAFEVLVVLAAPVAWAVGFWLGVQLRTLWPEP